MRRADVDLASGEASVQVTEGVAAEELVRAVQGKVIFAWARGALARLGRRAR